MDDAFIFKYQGFKDNFESPKDTVGIKVKAYRLTDGDEIVYFINL